MKPVIIVHGGAKTISADKIAANQRGCRAAVEAGWQVLQQDGSAIATGQPQGHVRDTALVGCGLYADNRLGALNYWRW